MLGHLDAEVLDGVLVEGFGHEHYPKVEVYRPSHGRAPQCWPQDPRSSPSRATSHSPPTAAVARPQRSVASRQVRGAPARPGRRGLNCPTPQHEKSSMAEHAPWAGTVDAVLDRLRTLPGALLPDPARHSGPGRVRAARGRAAHRRGAQSEPRRSARRHHVLPRFPLRAGRPARGARLPRRVVSVARRRSAAGARLRAAGRGGARHHAPTAPSRSSRSIVSATAPCRPRSWWTGRSTGGCRAERLNGMLDASQGSGAAADDPGLRPSRFRRAVGRRGSGRARHRGGGGAPRRAGGAGAERLARPLLAGAVRRGRDPGRTRGLRARSPSADVPDLFQRRLPRGPVAPRSASDARRRFPISRARSGSRSRGSASPIRSRSRTTRRTAAIAGSGGRSSWRPPTSSRR